MPRWARFLSCSVTGLLVSLGGLIATARWQDGSSHFWRGLFEFVTTPGFWYLVALLGLIAAATTLFARITVHLSTLSGGAAGLMTGGVTALVYAAFLVAAHAHEWGGAAGALQKAWPDALYLAAPFALSGMVAGHLWDRLS
jgi:hypothetical protein